MKLIKEFWEYNDGREFVRYLESLKCEDKVCWTKNILNTNMGVLAIKSQVLKDIAKEIKKGNYLSFLNLNLNDYYENSFINGVLITYIKDFDVMRRYLDVYSHQADCWATCDLLKFNIKNNEERFFKLAREYSKSGFTFIRRIGIIILFRFICNDKYFDKIYDILDQFENEKEYYVNMANSWILCELFIKRREETIEFLKDNKLNDFTMNKAISKCRDSFRVSSEDKEFLINFRR